MKQSDISKLISIVGRSGAVNALIHSEVVKIEDLRELAKNLDLEILAKTSKKDLANKVVRRVGRRIAKSVKELAYLTRGEIFAYLNETGCDAEDVKDLLEQAYIPVQPRMSRSELLKLASIQISSLGVFERLSNSGSSGNIQPK